jgi:riboflavin kinase
MAREPTPPDHLQALKALAELGAGQGFVDTRSGELGEKLGLSQQTASRRLLELEEAGLVQRRTGPRGQAVRLSAKGLDALRRELEDLKALVGGPTGEALTFRGKVKTGLGEGRYYMSRRGYQEAMKRLLGFAPWPGTLNVVLAGSEAEKLAELRARDGLLVPEFQDEGRTFGAVKCFRASVGGEDAGVVLPLRGHHADVLEVVAPIQLRERLGLKDGDEVAVEVTLK